MTKLKLYNTLTRKKEIFNSLKKGRIGIYACGPTVYDFAHIGNLRAYLFEDILKRVLLYNDYQVKHVMNITDVGHLTSDADTGEDKLEKGARREKKTVWEIVEFYTKAFKKDLKNLNILPPDVWLKATDTIKEQIDLIKLLEKKGFTYTIDDGVYFDTSKLKNYGQLWGSKKPLELRPEARACPERYQRVEMVKGKERPTDFALWKLTPKGVKRQMEWDSPWGKGFPGWHTECVVMGIKELGIPFDIHAGGIDHIPIHHTNEIAQAKAAYGKLLARFWLHGEFLILKKGADDTKMAKSEGNFIILDDLIKKGLNPLSYRYLNLTALYRSKLIFSWKSLEAAENALNNLREKVLNLQYKEVSPPLEAKPPKIDYQAKFQQFKEPSSLNSRNLVPLAPWKAKFLQFINNDLNIPKAVALMWQALDDKKLNNKEKYALLLDFDKVFGLGLGKIKKQKIPKQILELVEKREALRQQKEFAKADQIRKQIESFGWQVEDTAKGPVIKSLSD